MRSEGTTPCVAMIQQGPTTTLRKQYFSRRKSSKVKEIPKLAVDMEEWVGYCSPWALFTGFIFLCAPVAYIYILFILLRELCHTFPDAVYGNIQRYIPVLAKLISAMQKSSRIVEVWCVIEALFYLGFKLYIRWLQGRDTLEACLSAAPLMEIADRQTLWKRMMDTEYPDLVTFFSGWFFDQPIDKIRRFDVFDFLAWSMFEGRHQEHLTTAEVQQLESFVDEVEYRISLQFYGPHLASLSGEEKKLDMNSDPFGKLEDDDMWEPIGNSASASITTSSSTLEERSSSNSQFNEFLKRLPKPQRMFHFEEGSQNEERNFFSELFESYRARYEQMVSADFNPVKDFKNMVANATPDLRSFVEETKERIEKAEESAIATTRHVYETLIPSGSPIDKQLTAMSYATQLQLTEAWNSAKNMKEQLETARFLSKQRKVIGQQLYGYRILLNQMLESSKSSIPSKQMAALMRRITECYEAMERLEGRAQSAFVQITGFAFKKLPFLQRDEPQRFAKYSADPLLAVVTYPLGLHLSVFSGTEVALRIMMARRGFERHVVGPVSYYFHPGSSEWADEDDNSATENTPIVFVHGIGVGLIVYIPLIDALLKTGRPLFFPEIPYVTAFRPWQSRHSVLQPAVVCNTMSAMLASHGFLKGVFIGHSYGTSWISYMCKYASHSVAAAMFLDPVCFCLHVPRLTKSFVYMPPDPGTVSYFVRTDLMVNWTIQRSFPWAWIILFTEQITVPCSIFLSSKDALVPSEVVEKYLRSRGVPVTDVANVTTDHFWSESLINCCVFRDHGHGRWTETPEQTVPVVRAAVEVLCERAEKRR